MYEFDRDRFSTGVALPVGVGTAVSSESEPSEPCDPSPFEEALVMRRRMIGLVVVAPTAASSWAGKLYTNADHGLLRLRSVASCIPDHHFVSS